MWIENSPMCLINVAHEHFITQTGKKSKPALINFMGPEAKGPRANTWSWGPRKTNTLFCWPCAIGCFYKCMDKSKWLISSKDLWYWRKILWNINISTVFSFKREEMLEFWWSNWRNYGTLKVNNFISVDFQI